MNEEEARCLINGFVLALQREQTRERVDAFRELVEKGLRLSVAIDQPESERKPFDITFAAVELALSVLGVSQSGR